MRGVERGVRGGMPWGEERREAGENVRGRAARGVRGNARGGEGGEVRGADVYTQKKVERKTKTTPSNYELRAKSFAYNGHLL